MEAAVKWAQLYAAACEEVLAAANACLEVANPAVGARRQIAECQTGPQLRGTPIAIRNFTRMAEQKEEEFAPLYRSFEESCAKARETASQLLATRTELPAEMVLMFNLDEDVLDKVPPRRPSCAPATGPVRPASSRASMSRTS